MHRLGLQIGSDLRLSIGDATVQVSPLLGVRLAESLLMVSSRELVRQEAERNRAKATRIPVPRRARRA